MTALASNAAADGAELVFSAKRPRKVWRGRRAARKRRAEIGGAAVSLSAETRNIPGGVIVRNGRVEVNCAFDTLIGDQREELAAEAAKILF